MLKEACKKSGLCSIHVFNNPRCFDGTGGCYDDEATSWKSRPSRLITSQPSSSLLTHIGKLQWALPKVETQNILSLSERAFQKVKGKGRLGASCWPCRQSWANWANRALAGARPGRLGVAQHSGPKVWERPPRSRALAPNRGIWATSALQHPQHPQHGRAHTCHARHARHARPFTNPFAQRHRWHGRCW